MIANLFKNQSLLLNINTIKLLILRNDDIFNCTIYVMIHTNTPYVYKTHAQEYI